MTKKSLIWVDKYRPNKFNDIIGQEYFIKRIKAFVESKSLPHLLFAGSPGTGKTTTAIVIAKELYGKNGLSGNLLELNASDDRGIDVIRHKIKEFARLKSLTNIPYKLIILDEADSLTKEAQQALRRTMEKFSASCRFILACNEISKLIDPIQSRCVIFKFKPLEEKILLELIKKIEKEENIKVNKEVNDILISYSKGDLRKLVNTLQAATAVSKEITEKTLNEIIEFINPKEIDDLIENAIAGNFIKAREYMLKLRIKRGMSAIEILKEIYKKIISNDKIEPKTKIKFIDRIATVEFRIVEGSDEELQLEALLAMMSLLS